MTEYDYQLLTPIFPCYRLKQHLTAKLVDCGWFDEMKEVAQEVVRDRGGVTNITVVHNNLVFLYVDGPPFNTHFLC